MTKILVFGSSETWGAFDFEKGGWVERLKIYYLNIRPECKYYVYNFGISSDDSEGLFFRLKTQIEIIEKVEPDDYIFIFSIGKNDARFIGEKENKKVKINDFKENIKKIIKIAREYSSKIFFVGLPELDEKKVNPWNEKTKEYYENEDLENYDNKLREICKEEKINYIPIRNLLIKEDLYDGLHPNSEGHRKIFERVKTELNKCGIGV
jgi:lysophospholipase L1-like esterase